MVTLCLGRDASITIKMDSPEHETQVYSAETDSKLDKLKLEDVPPEHERYLGPSLGEEGEQGPHPEAQVNDGQLQPQTGKFTITLDTLRGYRKTIGCKTPRRQYWHKKERKAGPLVETRLKSKTNWEDFCSSWDDFRNAICRDHRLAASAFYEAWYFEKMEAARKYIIAKRKQERIEEERKEQALKDKQLEAECVFLSWKNKKTEELQKKLNERKKNILKKKDESKKKLEHLNDAASVFNAWKMQKDEEYRERLANERMTKAEEEFLAEEEKWEKRQEALAMFQAWKRMKDAQIAEDSAKLAMTEDRGKRTKDLLKQQRDTESLEAYKSWLQKKINEYCNPRTTRAKSASYTPPWFPPGVTIQY